MPSTLVSRNVRIAGRRTSVRLEREMWDALTDISKRENLGFNQLCTYVAATRRDTTLIPLSPIVATQMFPPASTPSESKNLYPAGR